MLEIDVGQPLKLSENGMEIMSNPVMEVSLLGANEISEDKDFSVPHIGEMYDILCSILLLSRDYLARQAEEKNLEFELLERNYNHLKQYIRKGLFWTKELLIPHQHLGDPVVKSILSHIPEEDETIDFRELKENGLSILINDYIISKERSGNLKIYITEIKEIKWPDNPTVAGRTGLAEQLGVNDYVKIVPNGYYTTSSPIRSISIHTKTGNVVLSSEYSPRQFSDDTGVIFKRI